MTLQPPEGHPFSQGNPQQILEGLLRGCREDKVNAATLVEWYGDVSAFNRVAFVEAGVVEALLPLAASGSRDPELAETSMKALLSLSLEPEGQEEMVANAASLIQVLKRSDYSLSARCLAPWLVENVASESDRARAIVAEAGAGHYLVKLLSATWDLSGAAGMKGGMEVAERQLLLQQQAAARALACLAQFEGTRRMLLNDGAVASLSSALRFACEVSESRGGEDVAREGGVGLVAEALPLAAACCSALSCLASLPDAMESMGPAIPQLVHVLQALVHPELVGDAVICLLLMARHAATYRGSIRSTGGMRHLRTVLRCGDANLHPKVLWMGWSSLAFQTRKIFADLFVSVCGLLQAMELLAALFS